MRTDNERFSLNKHHDWNGASTVYILGKSVQPSVSYQAADQNANFNPLEPATVTNSLVDFPSLSGGMMQFNDPWYLNSDGTQGNNFGPPVVVPLNQNNGMTGAYNQSTGGVFLNQDYNIPGNPYYSVGAPNPNTISNFTSYFQKWSGSHASFQDSFATETPVVFTNSGATATAKYKAYLGSSSSNATASNSQRKLAMDNSLSGIAYESAGQVWVSEEFQPEYRVSQTDLEFSQPSLIVVTGNSAQQLETSNTVPQIGIVYDEQYNGGHKVMFKEKIAGVWRGPYYLSQWDFESCPTHPVIGRTGEEPYEVFLLAVWKASNILKYRQAYYNYTSHDWTWLDEAAVPATSSEHANPSLTTANGLDELIFLTYDDGADVFVNQFHSNKYGWGGQEAVPASIAPLSHSSQISSDGSRPIWWHIAWEGVYQDVSNQSIWYQGYLFDNWTAAHEFVDANGKSYSHPSVTHVSSKDAYVAWDDGTDSYSAYVADDGTIYTYPSTVAPNFSHGSTQFVTTSKSGPPYALEFHNAASASPTHVNPVSQAYSRRVVAARERGKHSVVDSSSHFSVELQGITLKLTDGSMVPLGFVHIDEPRMNEENAWSRLATENFTLPTTIDSVIVDGTVGTKSLNWIRGEGENAIKLSLDVIDAGTGQLIQKIGNERLYTENGKRALNVRGKLAQIGSSTREVFIRTGVKGIAPRRKDIKYTLVHVHTLTTDTTGGSSIAGKTPSKLANQLPTEFALHQNFPNPFNPTTQINFDLPGAAKVSLVVYDLLGRKVAELANAFYEAGYHSAIWDARNDASGVYFARFTATGALGNVKLSKMSKLLLVK